MELKNQKPWHGLGIVVNSNLSPSEILYKLNIDRDYGSHPIPSGMPKNFANQETFRFFNAFFEAGGVFIETVGCMDGGRIIWALAPLKEDFTLKEKDTMKGYLLLASRNEDRLSIEIQFLMIRVACNNTIRIVAKNRSSFKNIFRREFIPQFPFMTSRVKSFDNNLIKTVKETIDQGKLAIKSFSSIAESLADKKMNDLSASRFMFSVFQPDTIGEPSFTNLKDIEELSDRKTRKGIEAITNAPGKDLESAKMTAWGLFNAVVYTVDHQLGNNEDSRLRMAWFGPNAKIKKRALDLAVKLAQKPG